MADCGKYPVWSRTRRPAHPITVSMRSQLSVLQSLRPSAGAPGPPNRARSAAGGRVSAAARLNSASASALRPVCARSLPSREEWRLKRLCSGSLGSPPASGSPGRLSDRGATTVSIVGCGEKHGHGDGLHARVIARELHRSVLKHSRRTQGPVGRNPPLLAEQ